MATRQLPFRFAVIGCGFFAQTQLHAWREIEGVELVAVCDVDPAKAEAAARQFAAPRFYTDAEEMLARESLNFVDIVTTPPSHRPLVELAARRSVDVICQKPMAWSLEDGQAMVQACRQAGVMFMVHENWRWQTPIRELKRVLDEGVIGRPFFGRISFRSDFDPFAGQAWLRETPRFVVIESGIHQLDVARFFFGEFKALFCQVARVNPTIKGEDVGTIMLAADEATCLVDLSFATATEHQTFPQTFITLEGPKGVLHLGADYRLTLTRRGSMEVRTLSDPEHTWTDRPWHVMQDSALHIQRHWVECLRSGRTPENVGEDNLRTLELVFGAYESAENNIAYHPKLGHEGVKNV
jgi:predicted dehydrogenase